MTGNESPLILIVDDAPLVARVYGQMLQLAGYRVASAATMTAAVTMADTMQPAAILLDWNLAGTAGGVVIRQLKLSERTRGIPVVVITAWATDEVRRSARIAGAKGFLAKPCDVQTLTAELQRVTAGH